MHGGDLRRARPARPIAADHDGGIEYVFPDPLDLAGDTVVLTAERAGVLERWLPEWQSYAATGLPLAAALVEGFR